MLNVNELGIFNRVPKPILIPSDRVFWRSYAVFNAGACIDTSGRILLFYRAVGDAKYYISRIGVAFSYDGVKFEYLSDEPLLYPDREEDWCGVEDPRVTIIENKAIITYTSLSSKRYNRSRISIGIAETINSLENIREIRKVGFIREPSPNKDASLIKIKEHYIIIHRPMGNKKWGLRPSIWCTKISNYKGKIKLNIKESWPLLMPREGELKVGLGPTPLQLESGEWLMIYHAVYEPQVYVAYAALVDKEFNKIISITPKPILIPKTPFEIHGHVPYVIFPEGLILKDDKLYLYYGAGDMCVMLATCDLTELLMILDKSRFE